MSVERSRIRLLAGGAALAVTLMARLPPHVLRRRCRLSSSTRARPEGAATSGWFTCNGTGSR